MKGCSCMSDYGQVEIVMARMTQAFDYSGNLSVKEKQNGWSKSEEDLVAIRSTFHIK